MNKQTKYHKTYVKNLKSYFIYKQNGTPLILNHTLEERKHIGC